MRRRLSWFTAWADFTGRADCLARPEATAAEVSDFIAAGQRLLAVLTPQDRYRGGVLAMTGAGYRVRFEQTGEAADLEAAVETGEQSLAAPASDAGNQAASLGNLSVSLLRRYERGGELADLDRSVDLAEQAMAVLPDGHPQHAEMLSNLSAVLKVKFTRADSPAEGLDRAIEVAGQAAAAMPDNSPALPLVLSNLGIALRTRAERTGEATDLDRAIEAGRLAVARTGPKNRDRALVLHNLGLALRIRAERTGGQDDLDEAIQTSEKAIIAGPPKSPMRATALSSLALALRDRYEYRGEPADLDRAIEAGEQAAAAAESADLSRPLAALSSALSERYGLTGNPEDLDLAVRTGEQADGSIAAGDANYGPVLSSLGVVLRTRYERTGALADLDRAIELSELAAAAAKAGPAQAAMCLANLGNALSARFEQAGAAADLDRAIEVSELALASVPAGHPMRSAIISNLGASLGNRFERAGGLADLDQAIAAGEEALAATPPSQVSYPRWLSNLSTDLQSRFELSGSGADLDRAIEAAEQAAATAPPGRQERAGILSNLGIALRSRFTLAGSAADLDRAIEAGEEAVAAVPPDHPDLAAYLCNLGSARRTRFIRSRSAADLDRGIEAGRAGAAIVTAPPADRQRSARLWADLAALGQNLDAAAAGYASATSLLALVAQRGLGRADQEYWLGQLSGLAQDAAAACLEAGQPERAVELWEQGRGVLLSQALDTRTDLTVLAERHPGLASAFRRLSDALDQAPARPDSKDLAADVREIGHRRALGDELEQVIGEIRTMADFERFLLPPPFAELLPAASSGPVVLVNSSPIRSDAMILTPAGIDVVELPDLSPQAVREHAESFLAALELVNDPYAGISQRGLADRQLTGILGWLWDAITGPVLDRLRISAPPASGASWPRLWWCPSGLLALLPLPAAGHDGATPTAVLDRAVSSCTPTVRALLHARRPVPPPQPGAGRLLIVAMPESAGAGDLPGAEREAELLAGLVADAMVLSGEHATGEGVTGALPAFRWAHFACHAYSDLAAPSASYLRLTGQDRLTLPQVDRLRLEQAGLAYLSACATARTGSRLADEAISLASGFQLAGYREVIATLWPVTDEVAVRVAGDVYGRLAAEESADAALALHLAVRRGRDLAGARPSAWAAYIHYGA